MQSILSIPKKEQRRWSNWCGPNNGKWMNVDDITDAIVIMNVNETTGVVTDEKDQWRDEAKVNCEGKLKDQV